MGGTGEHCLTSLTKIVIASVSARTLAIPRVYAIAVLLLLFFGLILWLLQWANMVE